MNIKLFTPFPAQKEFIDKFVETEDLFGCLVAPRGSGKTLAAINIALFWALSKKNQKLGWCSPTFSQSKNVLDRIVEAGKEIIVNSNRQEATITFINGSTIKFLSADSSDNIRGFRFTHLIIDETAYVKRNVLDTILLPTLNPNGKKCLMVSTPAGKNHFHEWYLKPDVVSHKIPLTECPYISETLIEEARKSLPPDIFATEYLAEFKDSSNDVFVGIDKVAIVNQYTNSGEGYVGIDTGLTDDMSVMVVINPVGRVLDITSMNNKPINTIAETFINKLSRYKILGGYCESNGIGKAMADLIRPRFKKIKEFTTTQASKQDMVRALISDIENNTVELPTDSLCPELHSEFSTYTYKMGSTGKLSFGHMPGTKDDHVDALLMANFSRKQLVNRKPMTVSSIPRSNVKPQWGSPR